MLRQYGIHIDCTETTAFSSLIIEMHVIIATMHDSNRLQARDGPRNVPTFLFAPSAVKHQTSWLLYGIKTDSNWTRRKYMTFL